MNTTGAFEIRIETTADVVIVRLIGEAGVQNVDEMERQLRPIAALRPDLLIFDLAGLGFISSLGLGILIELQRGTVRNGGLVRLAAPQPAIRDLLTKCRLDTVLPLYASVDEALVAS